MSNLPEEQKLPPPFHWRMQPYDDERYWCRCKRCRKCLQGLALHVIVRSSKYVYVEEKV